MILCAHMSWIQNKDPRNKGLKEAKAQVDHLQRMYEEFKLS